MILNYDYQQFYTTQLEDRHRHDYPPFARLIEITVKHTDKKICNFTASALTHQLRSELAGVKIFGPGEPMISKIRNQYLLTILIKIPRGKSDLAGLKLQLQAATINLLKVKEHRNTRIVIDVDPV
jgi:primosomal protein N' (replication factor Y)